MLNTKDRPVYCVGWVGSVSQAHASLWQPSPPKSYTKAESIQNWIDEYRSDANVLPFVGEISEVHVLDSTGKMVFNAPDMKRFMQWADLQAGFSAIEPLNSEAEVKAVFLGFNVKLMFQSLAAEMWQKDVAVPFRLWHGTPGLFDINDLLIPGVLRNGFDVGSLLAFGAARYLPANLQFLAGPGQAVMHDAETRAAVVFALARFAQLI